ncbi:MAG: response regulator [Anaerolineales bacterium]|nr:response regulator [Anaerolineales bacterium]
MNAEQTAPKINLLLVDDRPENLLALHSLLNNPEWNLVDAAAGAEALRRLLKQDFAAILLDVQMPEMDGFETAAVIRQRQRSRHTPIIFITAIGVSEAHVFKGYSVGAVDYIVKPIVPEILKSKVAAFVDLFRMRQQVQEQAERLAVLNQELAARIQESERLNRELQAVNKELEAFSYSVSHDLRAPLRTVAGFGDILLEDHRDRLNDAGRELIQRMAAAVKRMNEMIDAMLDLSRVTRKEMQPGTVDLSVMAGEIAAELRQREPKRQVEFIIAEDVTVQGDRRLLRMALENLLGNAWKFTGKQPKARIEFGVLADGELPAAISHTPSAVCYFVRDNGAGFDQTHTNKLFTAFQRLHSASEFSGTGIGLATVARIIHRHGGRIWAEGEVGKGATFCFTI